MSTPGHAILFSPQAHANLIPYLAALHASCITHDNQALTFLPPLSHEKLLSWWKDRIAEASSDTRLIWILVKDDAPRPSEQAQVAGPDLVGVVMLSTPFSETGPFRASVEKLLVHVNWRRRGGAKKLLQVLEAGARERGRTLLTLDTETDSDADFLYKRVGYVEFGRIPKHALSPTGELKECTFYYKHLEPDRDVKEEV